MQISCRGWIAIGLLAGMIAAAVAFLHPSLSAAEISSVATSRLTATSLGDLLQGIGLTPKRIESRYDFTFKAQREGTEWELSMTAVLSQDGRSVWIVAWLDALPRTSSEVPRTALLRLLALNDRLGEGKFFAYVPQTRRIVLERVLPNANITPTVLREALLDLGAAVADHHSQWNVAGWKELAAPQIQPRQAAANTSQPLEPRVIIRPKVRDETARRASKNAQLLPFIRH